MLTGVPQMVVDALALVGAWSVGGTVGRRIVRRRPKAPTTPYGAIPVLWQYLPGAFEPNNRED